MWVERSWQGRRSGSSGRRHKISVNDGMFRCSALVDIIRFGVWDGNHALLFLRTLFYPLMF